MLKNLDILHCKRKGVVPSLIRFFTKSRFSHTAIVIFIYDRPFILDAQAEGVNLRPFHIWKEEYQYSYEIARMVKNTSQKELDKILHRGMKHVTETKYDYMSLLWHHPKYILTGKWRGKKRQDALNRIYCSELIAYMYQMPFWWKRSPQSVYCYTHCSPDFQVMNDKFEVISHYGRCGSCKTF